MKKTENRFGTDIERVRLLLLIVFIGIITLLAWQSDDAYHGYVMAKHLVEGDGFVYNIGQRASASTAPLFTLIIALGYFITREMFFTSLFICVAFSAVAYYIVTYKICKNVQQVVVSFFALIGSASFVSYTTSGLENSFLFFLVALFLKIYFSSEKYTARQMLYMALIFSAVAMSRMDAVLYLIPAICYVFLVKRRDTSFMQAVGIGLLGLLPFILWEVFSVFYFGFPVPNTAYVKLGTDIAKIEFIKKGIWYTIFTFLNDAIVLIVPAMYVVISIISKRAKYLYISAGIIIYGAYVIYIGGDFMMGRHFTVMLIIATASIIELTNKTSAQDLRKAALYNKAFTIVIAMGIVYAVTFVPNIGIQYLAGGRYASLISDERAYYTGTTGLYSNIRSLIKDKRLCIEDTWNYDSTNEIREAKIRGNITENSPGILVYYNSDLYLNDTYALGDPFLSKLPAIRQENWRVGHLRRKCPEGYRESVWTHENQIENNDLAKYYDIIIYMTEGDLFDMERIKTVINWNLGKYNYLLDDYINTLE